MKLRECRPTCRQTWARRSSRGRSASPNPTEVLPGLAVDDARAASTALDAAMKAIGLSHLNAVSGESLGNGSGSPPSRMPKQNACSERTLPPTPELSWCGLRRSSGRAWASCGEGSRLQTYPETRARPQQISPARLGTQSPPQMQPSSSPVAADAYPDLPCPRSRGRGGVPRKTLLRAVGCAST